MSSGKCWPFCLGLNKLRVQLTIFQHWFRKWLGTNQATTHYLNQWWPMLPTDICVTRPQRVNIHQYKLKLIRKIMILWSKDVALYPHKHNTRFTIRKIQTNKIQALFKSVQALTIFSAGHRFMFLLYYWYKCYDRITGALIAWEMIYGM